MRVSNNIHNVACLDQVEFCQMWTEEEKIPCKIMPTAPAKPAEEKKADATPPKEGEQPPQENGNPTAPTVPEPPAEVEQ